MKCTYNKERGSWVDSPEFNGITDAQRDELQDLLNQAGIDVMTFCENNGIDSLISIESQHFEAVKADVIKQGQGKAVA